MIKYMKLKITPILLVLACCACTTIHKTEFYVHGWNEQISISETRIVFPPEGGTRTIVIAGTYEQFSLENTPEWLAYTADSTKLILSTSPNYTEEQLSATVRLIVTDGNSTAEDTLQVIQLSSPYENLSASGTSNCYVVSPGGGKYRFSATVKGSGNLVSDGTGGGSGVGVYIDLFGVSIENPCSAELLWETVPDGDLTSSHDVIDGEPIFCDGYIYFKTGNHAGNAVIAVKGTSGDILWSWHIWSPEDEPGTSNYNGYTWIDRNLGAINDEPGNIGNRGLLYQWGRKDPFIPSPTPYGENYGATSDRTNKSIGDGTQTQDYTSFSGLPYNEAPGNIPYSVRHPTTFINFAGYLSRDWYAYSYQDDIAYNSYLWGDPSSSQYSKSIFDPCPKGYVVAPHGAFYSNNDDDMSDWSEPENFGRYWIGGSGDFFPFTGFISGTLSSSQGPLYGCSGIGAYWTASPYPQTSGSYFMQVTETGKSYNASYRVYAFSIRCVKE